jgi:mono/diheme cytochrome c family protein
MPAALALLCAAVIAGAALDWRVVNAAGQKPAAAAQKPAASTDVTYKDVYEGWKWWHVYCYRCHGTNAIGGALAPNLISPTQQQSPAAFLKAVRAGKPETAMQAWDKLLTNKQIGQIHLYVRARADKVLPPGRPDEVGPNKGKWVPPAGWPAAPKK